MLSQEKKMKIVTRFTFVLSIIMTNILAADELMIFPSKGQSAEQLEKDKFFCYGWAKKESGFDPMAKPSTTIPVTETQKKSGGVVKGAFGGAVLGAIVGDSSSSAKRGAAAGGVIGGVRQRSGNAKQEKQMQQKQQQESNQYSKNRNRYNRAYSACLEGKGYTIK